jgi:outer membrane protein insertion porin family
MFINAYGASLGYGIPLSEFMRVDVGVTLSEYELMASFNSTDYVREWVQNPDHGRTFERFDPADPFSQLWGVEFRLVELNTGFAWDTRNRAIFPTRGSRRGVSFDIAVPPGDVTYFMGTLFNHTFIPVGREGVFSSRVEGTAGRGYADTVGLPPYRFIFAGGPQSVRGYRENWLGPQDASGFPVGGNVRIVGQFELMIPPPMERLRNATRVGVFFDVGNVFLGRDDVSLDELRMSTGLAATWLAPVGAIRISYAYPLNNKPDDRLERFQFTLGTAF